MTIVNRVLGNVHPGSFVLMHDGPAGRSQTLAALPYILAGLKARGLTPVSLPQLLFQAMRGSVIIYWLSRLVPNSNCGRLTGVRPRAFSPARM